MLKNICVELGAFYEVFIFLQFHLIRLSNSDNTENNTALSVLQQRLGWLCVLCSRKRWGLVKRRLQGSQEVKIKESKELIRNQVGESRHKPSTSSKGKNHHLFSETCQRNAYTKSHMRSLNYLKENKVRTTDPCTCNLCHKCI